MLVSLLLYNTRLSLTCGSRCLWGVALGGATISYNVVGLCVWFGRIPIVTMRIHGFIVLVQSEPSDTNI